jgi:tetratricopeptide (TPR) repeat protein
LRSELSPSAYQELIASYNQCFAVAASQSSDKIVKNLELLSQCGVNFNIRIATCHDSSKDTTPLKLAIVREQEKLALFIAKSTKDSLSITIQGNLPIEYAKVYKLKALERYISKETKSVTSYAAKTSQPILRTDEFTSKQSDVCVAEFVSYLAPKHGSIKQYTNAIQNLISCLQQEPTARDIIILSKIGYQALTQENDKVFAIIERGIRSTPKDLQHYEFLVILYNESFCKNNQTDNIKASATSLSKALEIVQNESIAKSLSQELKAAAFYNETLIAIRYCQFDRAIEAMEAFATLTPDEPDFNDLNLLFAHAIYNYTHYIPHLRLADKASQILGQYPELLSFKTTLTTAIHTPTKKEALLEDLISTPTVPEEFKPGLRVLSDKPDNIAMSQKEIQEIYASGDKIAVHNIVYTAVLIAIEEKNPQQALSLLEAFNKSIPGLLQDHNNIFLAEMEFLAYIQNDHIGKALVALQKIYTIWSTLTDLGLNTQYNAHLIPDTTATQYITYTLIHENHEMAAKGLQYLPQNELSKYEQIIKSREHARKKCLVLSKPVELAKELKEDEATTCSAETTTELVVELSFQTRIIKPLKTSPLPYSLAALSTMIDTNTIEVISLHPSIQNVYFGYSSLLLNQHNMERLNPHNLASTWLVGEKQYVHNPSSPNNIVYHITHNLYATIDQKTLVSLKDQITATQFKCAIETCRITREFGQKGIKFLSQGHYELKIHANARMTGEIFENPARKQLIEFNKLSAHEVFDTQKNNVTKVGHIEQEAVQSAVADAEFQRLEDQYFHLLKQLGEQALTGEIEFF